MKAVMYKRPKKMSVEEVPDPRIEHPRDAVVRVTKTAICGSDLHIYNGLVPQIKDMIVGHEFMGVVEEVGDAVDNLTPGDRVVVPFPVADGSCWFCTHGLPTQCENSNPNYGPEGGILREKGGGIFGYTDLYGGISGGQAEKVRVPYADYGPRKIPDGVSDDNAVFLADVLPTAYQAIDWARVKEGETVAVYGCGPIGIATQKIAKLHGAGDVIGVDVEDYRLDMARRTAGAATVNADEDDSVEFIRERTDGRGADVVVDAVGMEAHRNILEKANAAVHLQRGTMKVLKNTFSAVRRGGRVSVMGVYATPFDNFPLAQMFDKELQVTMGQALVHEHIDHLMGLVADGQLRADDMITHKMSLDDAPHGYEIFNEKKDDCVKVVLEP